MARRTLSDKTAWDDQYDYVAYVVDALEGAAEDGDTEVGALAATPKRLLRRYDDLATEQRAARRDLNRSHGRVRRRDVEGDLIVTDVHHDALALARQDRGHALFKRLFPDALYTVVKMALESELPVLRALNAQLASADTPAALRKAHQRRLAAMIDRGDAAVTTRIAAYAEVSRVGVRIATWREDANAVLRGVEGALQQLASTRRLPPWWVDAFFPAPRVARRASRKPATPPPAAPTPTTPA